MSGEAMKYLTPTTDSTPLAKSVTAAHSTHTPGPWRVAPLAPNESQPGILGANGYWVATAHTDANYAGDDGVANANLIAAAPDLLAALVEILLDNPAKLVIQDHTLEAASAAIKKARGL